MNRRRDLSREKQRALALAATEGFPDGWVARRLSRPPRVRRLPRHSLSRTYDCAFSTQPEEQASTANSGLSRLVPHPLPNPRPPRRGVPPLAASPPRLLRCVLPRAVPAPAFHTRWRIRDRARPPSRPSRWRPLYG